MSNPQKIKTRKKFNYLIVALSVFLVAVYYVYSVFLTTRPLSETGAYVQPAYTIFTQGGFVSPSSKGILNMDKFTYWIPPLHTFLQVPFYFLIGFGLWQIITIQTLILLMNVYAVKKFSNFLKISAIIPIALLLTNRNFLVDSFAARPDTIATFFGTISILSLLSLLHLQKSQEKKKFNIYLFLTGISLGFSILSYQLAGLYAIAISIFLLISRQLKLLVKILAISMIIVLPYVFYILVAPQIFWLQTIGIYRTTERVNISEIVKTEFLRYVDFTFYAPGFAFLFLFSLYKGLNDLKNIKMKGLNSINKEIMLIILTIMTFLITFFFMTHKISFTMILVMPLMALLIGYYVKDIKIITVAVLVNVFFALLNVYVNLPMSTNPSFLSFSKTISDKTSGTVLTYDTFFPILKEKLFSYQSITYAKLLGTNVTQLVENVQPSYIVLQWDDELKSELIGNYKLEFNVTRNQPSLLSGSVDRTLQVFQRIT